MALVKKLKLEMSTLEGVDKVFVRSSRNYRKSVSDILKCTSFCFHS